MSEIPPGTFKSRSRGNWIRLRTLVVLRWWAIAGQVTALIVAQRLYNLDLEIGLCFLVIGVSVVSNLVAAFIYPENKRLSESETLLVVLFDMLQLGLLLFLTGGLNNPFSILIVGPVTVSASAISSRSTMFLGLTAILTVSLLTQFHLPLRTEQDFVLRMPDLFLFGNWAAIVIAIIFLGVYSRWIVSEMDAMSDALQATQMALAREQKLTDLGGVIAAAAHELGTPLATIKLTSAELADELSDNTELRDDALLIRQQADRCRDILRSMGRAGKDDMHLRKAPLTAILDEAAEPHIDRGKRIHFVQGSPSGPLETQPTIYRRPEVVHGLRNLIQNAVDFARANVWIECWWDDTSITVRIMDDGRGYSPHVLSRIGEPFMRRRGARDDTRRPGYEGMGLGLFIAKTLLERSGADLSFANASDATSEAGHHPDAVGAVVQLTWPRARIEAETADDRRPSGENLPFRA
ncbi:two-component system sensor histidine kinase RegB [Roseovarius halotolerans]|uniref:histidine kinase n=1 Tax=Roseovarius halotolerans TaxID=505353 RepID=A0A1X6Z2L3_9RHOB|nr:ActS/PrrB/RegB family redox-sensitive histidine kinase [Roseovarius halotolerans]RKT32325.1 two-component system sensor histidine kinase RegB [Roseovarius halotolerans]SLN38737.1 Sensor histidine kinase RegB [Roseovarius halotolerans]